MTCRAHVAALGVEPIGALADRLGWNALGKATGVHHHTEERSDAEYGDAARREPGALD